MDLIQETESNLRTLFSSPIALDWDIASVLNAALLIVVITGFIFFVKLLLGYLTSHHKIRTGRAQSIYQLSKYIVFVLGFIFLFQILGIDLSLMLTASAVIIFAIGLGLQQLFNDILFGIIFLFDGSLQKGDIIMFEDDRNTIARVKKVGIRISYVETKDDIVILVPNSQFSSGKVINLSHTKHITRFSVGVDVAYSTDVEKAIKTLKNVAEKHSKVKDSPSPLVHIIDFRESSIGLELLFWTSEPFEIDNTLSEIRFAIIEEFRKNKITIPFPQRDVHLSK